MGETSPAGLPYPEPAEYLAGGAAAIQALAEAVDFRTRTLPHSITIASGLETAANTLDFGYTYVSPPLVLLTGWNQLAGVGDPLHPTSLYGWHVYVYSSNVDHAGIGAYFHLGENVNNVTIYLAALIIPTSPE